MSAGAYVQLTMQCASLILSRLTLHSGSRPTPFNFRERTAIYVRFVACIYASSFLYASLCFGSDLQVLILSSVISFFSVAARFASDKNMKAAQVDKTVEEPLAARSHLIEIEEDIDNQRMDKHLWTRWVCVGDLYVSLRLQDLRCYLATRDLGAHLVHSERVGLSVGLLLLKRLRF